MTTRGFEDFRHLDAVLALIGGEAANVDRLLQSFDADRFCRWCLRQQVGGLAYLLLEDASLRVGPAKALLAGLRAAYLDQWARSERLRLHLATLDRLLRRVGADYLVLKGLPFALRYYGAYDRRSTGDIDIWVRRGDAHRVATALEGEGLVRHSPRYSEQSSAFEHLHHVELTLDGTGVELHHALRVHPTFKISDEAIWDTRTPLDILGTSYATLSDEHALLLHLLGLQTDVQIGSVTARWFADLYAVLLRVESAIDWETFFERRAEEGTRKICVNSLAMFLVVTRRDDCFPRLSAALATHRGDVVLPPDRVAYLELLCGSSMLARKAWPLKQYEGSVAFAAGWWLSGMPQRIAAKPEAFARDASGPSPHSAWEGAAAARNSPALSGELGVNVATSQEVVIRFGSLAVTVRYERASDLEALRELFRVRPGLDDGSTHRLGHSEMSGVIHLAPRRSDELAQFRRPITPVVDHKLEHVLEIREGIVHAWISEGSRFEAYLLIDRDRQTPDLLLHSMMVVLNRLLARLNRYHVHAASVGCDGGAALFVGAKGSGKSTISLALGRVGHTVFSEDHVFVRRQNSRFFASGCDGDMHLTNATEQHFFGGPVDGRVVERAGVTKKQIDMASVIQSRPYVDVEIACLFFPRVSDRFEIQALSKEEALARIVGPLAERHRFGDRDDLEQFLKFISDLVESCATWELSLSRDLTDLQRLAAFLADPRSRANPGTAPPAATRYSAPATRRS